MAHGYGDGFYGSYTYGSLDGSAQPTLLTSAGLGTAVATRGEVASWRLAAAGPSLTVAAVGAARLSVLIDELI